MFYLQPVQMVLEEVEVQTTNTPAGWENGFDVSGQKHTVIVTKEGNYLEGENQWSRF